MPIHYVSMVLNGAEGRYTPTEKMALASVITVRSLRPLLPLISLRGLGGYHFQDDKDIPRKTHEKDVWLLHVDGSSTTQGSGADIVITSPQGEDMEFVVIFEFKASNNEAKYEALVMDIRMVHEVGAQQLVAYSNAQLIFK
ncbi:UNVERIFIED_CONTAM: hypothetical protein Sradi_6126400 [Sesamum radiatum]|uniref:Uncharacterized protein n=1 Tax=Sesamum radiatum TaxID=300843 RepID=A0AAW2KM60_SESRA